MNPSSGVRFCSNLWQYLVVKFLNQVTYFPHSPCFTAFFFFLFSTFQSKFKTVESREGDYDLNDRKKVGGVARKSREAAKVKREEWSRSLVTWIF